MTSGVGCIVWCYVLVCDPGAHALWAVLRVECSRWFERPWVCVCELHCLCDHCVSVVVQVHHTW